MGRYIPVLHVNCAVLGSEMLHSVCVRTKEKQRVFHLWAVLCQTYMQHEFGVSVDEFDQSEEEALVTSSVEFCGFLFEFKAGGHLLFKRQTLLESERQCGGLWLHSGTSVSASENTSPCGTVTKPQHVRSSFIIPLKDNTSAGEQKKKMTLKLTPKHQKCATVFRGNVHKLT